MKAQEALKNALSLLGVDFFHFQEVQSTQDSAFSYALNYGFERPMIFMADIQTKGRGKGQRIWESGNNNIQFSYVCTCPRNLDLKIIPQISELSALVLVDTLDLHRTKEANITMKKPNDVLVAGKKCAGILPELHEIRGAIVLIIGFGINWGSLPIEGSSRIQDLVNVVKETFLCLLIKNLQKMLIEFFDYNVNSEV